MEKKIFYVLYVIGVISFLFPFYQNSALGCGADVSIISHEYRYLYQDFYEMMQFLKLQTEDIVALILFLTFFSSILLAPIFYHLKKYIIILVLCIITLCYLLLLAFANRSAILSYGFYILLFQQIGLLIFLQKYYFFKNKKQ